MTISTTTVRMNYTGTGLVSIYPYTYRIDAESDLEVLKTDSDDANLETLVLNTDYTVSGVGSEAGGNVTLTTALEDTYNLSITRVSARTQLLDLLHRGQMNPESLEDSFDKAVLLIQELTDDVRRCAKVSRTSGAEGSAVTEDLATDAAASAAAAAVSAAAAAAYAGGFVFSGTGSVTGSTVATIALSDNTGTYIDVYGSGLKNGSIAISKASFSIYRTTGTCTINKIDDEFADGADYGAYFEVEVSGNGAIVKAYTDANTWTVSGSIDYPRGSISSIS